MIDPNDLQCRYTVKINRRRMSQTVGFRWEQKSTGKAVATSDGHLTQQSMRLARDAAYRTLTGKEPNWSTSQYPPEAA